MDSDALLNEIFFGLIRFEANMDTLVAQTKDLQNGMTLMRNVAAQMRAIEDVKIRNHGDPLPLVSKPAKEAPKAKRVPKEKPTQCRKHCFRNCKKCAIANCKKIYRDNEYPDSPYGRTNDWLTINLMSKYNGARELVDALRKHENVHFGKLCTTDSGRCYLSDETEHPIGEDGNYVIYKKLDDDTFDFAFYLAIYSDHPLYLIREQ
jgi:hypothetical protein